MKTGNPAKRNRIELARWITIRIDWLLNEKDRGIKKSLSLHLEIRTQRDRKGPDNKINVEK